MDFFAATMAGSGGGRVCAAGAGVVAAGDAAVVADAVAAGVATDSTCPKPGPGAMETEVAVGMTVLHLCGA